MTRTGPQKYPGASLAYWYQDNYPGSAMEVNVVVLHTTEGRTLPSYGGGSSAPNLTAVPDFAARRLRWYQHYDIDTSSRALRNLAGGVETNTLNVCQVELVGTCDPSTHTKWGDAAHIYWPQAPDWALAEVADFLAWMHDEHAVPLSGPSKWPAYPASYGAGGGQRMSNTAWNGFSGVCGHMHVPENDHGDPGAIDFGRLIALAKGTPMQEDTVAFTKTDLATLAHTDGVFVSPDGDQDPKGNTHWSLNSYTRNAYRQGRETNTLVKQLAAAHADPQPVTLTDAQIQALATNPALAEAIAERVTAKLAERLSS